MARQSSMQCRFEGLKGTVQGVRENKKIAEINGAWVVIVTNRFSGLLVELLSNHGPYRKGQQVMIGENNFDR